MELPGPVTRASRLPFRNRESTTWDSTLHTHPAVQPEDNPPDYLTAIGPASEMRMLGLQDMIRTTTFSR